MTLADPSPCLGIDFGTTTSLVAAAGSAGDPRGVLPELIPIPQDGLRVRRDRIPTLLYFPRRDRLVVGEAAREQLGVRPDRVLRRLKLLLGRFDRITVAGHSHDPVALVAAVLRRLRAAAETARGARIRSTVLSVPASFDARRRRALLEAAAAAGFEPGPHTLIDEPIAALAAWLHDRLAGGGSATDLPRTVLVLDVGGGTSDACVARLRPDGPSLDVETLALSPYTPVGGDDFDALVAWRLLCDFRDRAGLDPNALPPSDRLLLEYRVLLAAERAKLDVAAEPRPGAPTPAAEIRHLFLHGTHHLIERIDADRYHALVAPLLADPRLPRPPDAPRSVLDAVFGALDRARLEPGAIDRVLLAGGMARLPALRRAVAEAMGREPEMITDPDTAIVRGAVVQHAALRRGLRALRPAAPIAAESIGVLTSGGGFRRLIAAGTPLPASVVEPDAFVVPAGRARYVRVPIGVGERPRGDPDRLLLTLALRFPASVPAGTPIRLEARMDANKVLTVRGALRDRPETAVEASLPVGPAGEGDDAGDPV
jgi:molecular chaperone DnaK (HSP70)